MRAQTVYLCPSDRAARAFRDRLAAREGVLPECVDFERFCRELWQRGLLFGLIDDERELLDTRATSMLWRQIVASTGTLSAAEIARIAALAGEAWTIAHRHDLPLRQIAAYVGAGGNAALFAAYSGQMQAILRRNRGITAAELLTALDASLERLQALLPVRVVLTPSFTSSPARERLVRHLQELGVTVESLRHDASPGAMPVLARFDTEDAEMRAAIAWAAAREAEGMTSIAIVVPDLAARRSEWTSALRQQFGGAEWILDPAVDRERFDVSIGLALADYPYVSTLLNALRAAGAEVDTEQLMQSLLHPRWGRTASELRQIERHGISLLDLGIDRARLERWLAVLPQHVPQALDFDASHSQPRAAHATTLSTLAVALTGAAQIFQSDLFQLDEAWTSLLQAWIAADRWLPPLPWHAALRELSELASEQLFQPVSGRGPVQVMGLLESAGVPMDAIWITGLNDQVLPERLRPNPMLPRAWQAQQRVGLGSQEEAEARASRLWTNWRQLSPTLAMSYCHESDGGSVRVSPLSRGLTIVHGADAAPAVQPRTMVIVEADEYLPVTTGAAVRPISARALEDQANCPRRASAVRLGLEEWPEHAVGIPRRLRGTLVHEVMAALGRARMHEGADNVAADAAHESAMSILDACIARERELRPRVPALVWRSERRRIDALTRRVLLLESARRGFSIEAVESDLRGELDDTRFSLRADRVDRARESGAGSRDMRVVFDYKTGRVARKDWFAETSSGRLAAPQLPLYALLLTASDESAPVRAIAYIVVSDDECKFVAVGEDDGLPTATTDGAWDNLIAGWRVQIGALIEERRQGIADVAPLKGLTTCRSCAFGPFCREPWSLTGDEAADVDAVESGDE